MDRDDGETSYNTFVDDVALEPTYLQALPTAAGRNVATIALRLLNTTVKLNCDLSRRSSCQYYGTNSVRPVLLCTYSFFHCR